MGTLTERGSGEPGRRRNVWFPDRLWALAVEAASSETVCTGHFVSVSEWIRRAVERALASPTKSENGGLR